MTDREMAGKIDGPQQVELKGANPESLEPRWVRSPVTGHLVVAARPGERKITSDEVESRWKRCPITGDLVVAARPGARKVTSEEIYEWLRELEIYDMMRALDP